MERSHWRESWTLRGEMEHQVGNVRALLERAEANGWATASAYARRRLDALTAWHARNPDVAATQHTARI
ncbi:hypothetical protein AB0M39_39690 [Streptomyces sp. NPDC051907]|uniref:hypothetical protein n=1 Tax=Streptomyces sp. NPDC051907 TaxID=3155284 RepID=UPI003449746C